MTVIVAVLPASGPASVHRAVIVTLPADNPWSMQLPSTYAMDESLLDHVQLRDGLIKAVSPTLMDISVGVRAKVIGAGVGCMVGTGVGA